MCKKYYIIAFIALLISTDIISQNHSEIFNDVITVNSRTKWKGINRKVVQLKVPDYANGVYVSIKVGKIGDISIAEIGREFLLNYFLRKKKYKGVKSGGITRAIEKFQSRYENVNLYQLSDYYQIKDFKKHGHYNFKRINEWKDVGHQTFFIKSRPGSTIYLGVYNNNNTVGLDVSIIAMVEY